MLVEARRMLVYLITNRINGKVYVGKTECGINKRWRVHIWSALHRPAGCVAIGAAIRKYGESAFQLTELADMDTRADLEKLERQFIVLFESQNPKFGYNCTGGGEGGYAAVRTPEQRLRWAELAKARWANPEWAEKTKLAMRKGLSPKAPRSQKQAAMERWASSEQRAAQSERLMGHNPSIETRAKMSRLALERQSDLKYRKQMSERITEWWKTRKET